MEDSDVITVMSLPENSVEITSTEAEPLDENNIYVAESPGVNDLCVAEPQRENVLYSAESIEVISTDESIICLDEDEIIEEPLSINSPLSLPSTNLPVIMPFVSDRPESPSNENDDDFSIIYEKKAPPVEVEILENYRSSNVQASKKHRKSQDARPSDQRENHNTNQAEVTEQMDPSLDDSIYIIDRVAPVIRPVNHQSNVLNSLQQAVLASTEKKKRKIECGVCFDGPDEIEKRGMAVVSTVCGHIFCSECITVSIKSFKHCPQCRKKLTMKQFHVIYV